MTTSCSAQPAAAWEADPPGQACWWGPGTEVVAICTYFEMQKFYSVE